MSNTSLKTTVEWHKINWRKLERRVYKLQKRIYRASQRGDVHRHCHDTKTANDGSPGNKSDCKSVEPKPTKRLEKVQDKWVMRYA